MNNVIQMNDFHINPMVSYSYGQDNVNFSPTRRGTRTSNATNASDTLSNRLVVAEEVQEVPEDSYDENSQNITHLQLGKAILHAKYICKGFIAASLIKILLLGTLMIIGFDDKYPQEVWLYFMLSYDVLYIVHNLTIIFYLHKTPLRFLLLNYEPTDPEYQDINLSGFIIGQCLHSYHPINSIQIMSSCEHYFKCVGGLAEFLRIYYMMIFIFGNIFLYLDLTSNGGYDEILFLIFLSLGYIYLIIPLLLCLTWPCLIVGIYCVQFNQNNDENVQNTLLRQKPIDKGLVQKHLKSKKYSQVMPEEALEQKEICTICYIEYSENEKVIQLPCNLGHYFHKECCEKWLNINGTCPICRQDIEKLLKDSKK